MKSRTNRNIENGAMDKMEKRLNKISTAEMKKNMSEDTMTICECCEFLETMIGDDKNILDCINYIERRQNLCTANWFRTKMKLSS